MCSLCVHTLIFSFCKYFILRRSLPTEDDFQVFPTSSSGVPLCVEGAWVATINMNRTGITAELLFYFFICTFTSLCCWILFICCLAQALLATFSSIYLFFVCQAITRPRCLSTRHLAKPLKAQNTTRTNSSKSRQLHQYSDLFLLESVIFLADLDVKHIKIEQLFRGCLQRSHPRRVGSATGSEKKYRAVMTCVRVCGWEEQKGSCNFIPVLCKCFLCAVFDNVKLVFLWFVRCKIDYLRCT